MARVQRQRIKGWRKPPGAVFVGRPGPWGNPFLLADHGPAEACRLFEAYLLARPDLIATARPVLADQTLMCWCPLDQPCHADVWVRVLGDVADAPALG